MIGHETLRAIGEALYGDVWIIPLAMDLGINQRTVERWAADKQDIPSALADELLGLCQNRAEGMRRLAVRYEERARAVDRAARVLSLGVVPTPTDGL